MTVYRCGEKVEIGESIVATVTGITIRGGGYVQYEVSWWNGNCHECKWVDACEVRAAQETETASIGFTRNGAISRT